jgi:hypothetical protein
MKTAIKGDLSSEHVYILFSLDGVSGLMSACSRFPSRIDRANAVLNINMDGLRKHKSKYNLNGHNHR